VDEHSVGFGQMLAIDSNAMRQLRRAPRDIGEVQRGWRTVNVDDGMLASSCVSDHPETISCWAYYQAGEDNWGGPSARPGPAARRKPPAIEGGPLGGNTLLQAGSQTRGGPGSMVSGRLIGGVGAVVLVIVGLFAYSTLNNRSCTVAFTASSTMVTVQGKDSVGTCSRLEGQAPAGAGAHQLQFWEQPSGTLVCQANIDAAIIVVRRNPSDTAGAALAGQFCAALQQ
jgi:hypothetical protein